MPEAEKSRSSNSRVLFEDMKLQKAESGRK